MATFVVVVAVAFVAWGWLNGRGLPAPLASLLARVSVSEESVVVRDGDAIECFTGSDGEYLVYVDNKGTDNVVESPAQVPAKYRGSVRCVQLKR
ncbi:MAG: hypothetical protein Q8O67_27265 [Deltaproteobacteria bacterium]|nr:hypothetical protein [Deltaproteobacteria bacterium]